MRSWTQKPLEEYVQEYHERAAFGGHFIVSPDQRMCTEMFQPETKESVSANVGTCLSEDFAPSVVVYLDLILSVR